MYTEKIDWDKVDYSNIGKEWRVNLVRNIENRNNTRPFSFESLPEDRLYDLHIEYNIERVKPYDSRQLTYENLKKEIAANLVAPSHLLMKIFVAPSQRGKD